MNLGKYKTLVWIGIFTPVIAFSQGTSKTVSTVIETGANDGQRVIQTPVPFLNIVPESRGGAMGDAGAATSPDVNSMQYNPAKYAFVRDDAGIDVSYSPWLRALVNDINLAYVAGYKRINRTSVVAGSFRYFSLGEILFTDQNGSSIGQHTPNELAVDGAYSMFFSDNFSFGVAFRYIFSNLTSGINVNNTGVSKPGQSVAADVSGYHQKKVVVSGMESLWTWGFDVSNIGTKMSYSDNAKSDFIPTNLRIGTAMTNNIDNYNSITYTIDLNKLLVPTPPEYAYDAATGNQIVDANGDPKIHKGMDPNVAVLQGMVQSLYDAPGGYKEKLQEIMISVGAEYWYANQFALRGGYFNESENKGNRKYFTLGLGMKMNVFNIDFSYLLPTSGRNNPLANTMRFSLGFNFAKQKAAKKPAI